MQHDAPIAMSPADAVPVYVRRVLCVGDNLAGAAEDLRQRGISVAEAPDLEVASSGSEDYECIVVSGGAPVFANVRRAPLSPYGAVLCLADAPASECAEILKSTGFRVTAVTNLQTEPPSQALLAFRMSYDPHEHARALRTEGRPDLAYCVLRELPLQATASDKEAVSLATELEVCLLDLDRRTGGAGRVTHFFSAEMAFYVAVAREPRHAAVYQCQAEFWRRMGSLDMARRLLRSIQHVNPAPAVENQLASYQGREDAPRPSLPDPPEWEGTYRPRILFVTHRRIDYGLDVLCDGLRSLLGPQTLVEYPWKPSLHGEAPPTFANYPASFNHPGEPLDLDGVLLKLRGREFDLLLFGDTELQLDRDEARRIFDAAGDIPWAILDQRDDPVLHRDEVLAFLGRHDQPPYFKREMLACVDYGPGVYPLPFAYPDGRIPAPVESDRSEPLFWAGHRQFGLRRLYLERIEAVLGRSLGGEHRQEEYASLLSNARAGLSIFGAGFDTVRYWELPAHGCLLLAERPPIRIPHNFEDGGSAIFFDDLPELEERLEHCLSHPEEVNRIAAEGRAHLLRHHTASARARQLLARLATDFSR